jgi:DNA-binding SARP family transcriptional activator
MSASVQLRVHLLGGFHVVIGGRDVPDRVWRQRKVATLIKLLALDPSHRLHRERIMDTLWPELGLDAQANNLSVVLHHARRLLAAAGAPSGAFLAREGEMLVLGPPAQVWVDVDAFESAARDAWPAQEHSHFRCAAALYTGDLLPEDPFDEWLDGPRTRLRTTHQALLARLAQLEEERGEIDAATATLQQLVSIEPAHEEAHASLMRLYARTGQRSQALAQYELLKRTLARELDAAPDDRVQELFDAIRSGRVPADMVREADASRGAPSHDAGQVTNISADGTSSVTLDHDMMMVTIAIVERAMARLLGAHPRDGQPARCSNRRVERLGRPVDRPLVAHPRRAAARYDARPSAA